MNHIEIYVANLANTVQFYHWLLVCNLEFELDTHWVNGVTFRQGDCYLVFVEVAKEKQSMGYNRTHIGLNHLAFRATSRLKVDQIHDQLTIMNPTTLLYDQLYPFAGGQNQYAVYFEDPDRIKLEVVAV